MHSKRILFVFIFVLVAVGAALAFSPRRPQDTQVATIAVTSYPLYDIVRMVAGPDATVAVVLPPGGNPHTFEPTPATARLLANAKVVYAVGHGFDDWIDGLLTGEGAAKVVVDADIALRTSAEHEEEEEEEEEEEHGHGATDPHYWLDARNAAQIARTVAADLTARQPQDAGAIAENLAAAEASLLAADARIRDMLADVPRKNIVTLHDAWYYFGDAYGLHVTGSFEPSAGREPSPRTLAALEAAVRDANVTVVYKEPGLPTAGLESFAADNGLTIVEIDPVEGATSDGYVETMLRNAAIIQQYQRK